MGRSCKAGKCSASVGSGCSMPKVQQWVSCWVRSSCRTTFPPAAKKRYVDLVETIRSAYHDRIAVLPWMSVATKAKAQRKLAAITAKVGYPDKWKDYSALVIGRDSYCENMMNAARWRFNDEFGKYGKPVDRSEWDMTPQTYNAYYSQNNNEIVLPAAAFMIPGVPDAQVDDAVIYGYAGAATIGHEITHGFDDSGRKYDAAGNLNDWWTAGDAKEFQERADVLAKQFDRYEPLPGLHINGEASLGENIGDYGGLLLGLDAFKKTEQFRKGELIGGLTPLQRYFLGYALGWLTRGARRNAAREPALRRSRSRQMARARTLVERAGVLRGLWDQAGSAHVATGEWARPYLVAAQQQRATGGFGLRPCRNADAQADHP